MGNYADRKAANKCVGCGYRDPEPNKVRCSICAKKKSTIERNRILKRVGNGICRCGKPRDSEKKLCSFCLARNNSAKKVWRTNNPEYNTIAARKRFLDALNQYGGPICKCCGETNVFFLTIDHVNNDGAQHRRETGGKSGKNLAWWLKKHNYPPGYQVMCFNCNCGRARNNGICPHHGTNPWL